MRTVSFLALPLLTLVPIARQNPEAERAPTSLVRVERDHVVIESGARLDHVVEKLAPIAQRPVLVKVEVARRLESTTVRTTQPLSAVTAKAGELLESVLFANDVVLIPPAAAGQPWDLIDLKGNERQRVRSAAMRIKPEEIDAYASRYIPLSVAVPIQNANAREIAASLRPFFPDSNLESMTNVGNTNAVLIFGFGPTVASMASMIRQLDDEKLTRNEPMGGIGADELARLKARLDAIEKRLAALAGEPQENAPAARPKK